MFVNKTLKNVKNSKIEIVYGPRLDFAMELNSTSAAESFPTCSTHVGLHNGCYQTEKTLSHTAAKIMLIR